MVIAMSASCSAVGSGMTPQSARKSTPSTPNLASSDSRICIEETVSTPAWRGIVWRIVRSPEAAWVVAPEMRASAPAVATIMQAK